MKKILCIRSDRFGEFLCSLPAIKLLRINYPQSIIYLLASKPHIELIKGADFIDYFLEYREDIFRGYKGAFRLAGIFKKECIDSIVILNPKKEFHLAAFLAGAVLRLGYDRKWGFCLNKRISDRKYLEQKHENEYNVDLVSLVCERVFMPRIELPVGDKKKLDYLKEEVDLRKKYIVIHPFSSNTVKEIDIVFWGKLFDKLKMNSSQEIIVIGGSEDKVQAAVYRERFGLKDLAGKLSLNDLAAFIKYNCFLFVGLDSGPMHLASLLNVPIAALFKASSPLRWGPWSKETLVIKGKTTTDFINKIEEIVSFVKKQNVTDL